MVKLPLTLVDRDKKFTALAGVSEGFRGSGGWGVPVPAHSPAWGDTKQTSLSGFLVFVEAREKEE